MVVRLRSFGRESQRVAELSFSRSLGERTHDYEHAQLKTARKIDYSTIPMHETRRRKVQGIII